MIPANRLVISSIMGGQETYEKPFFLDNISFPVLQNALCYRKSIIKRQGDQLLEQLRRSIGTTGASPFTATISPAPLPHGTSRFQIGSVVLVDGDITNGITATLTSSNGSYSGTLNRSTGALSITIPAIAATTVYFYPGLPGMGVEPFEPNKSPNTQIDIPNNVFFDQTYAYQFDGTNFYDVSFYKGTNHPVYWTGANYQQFWSTNYYKAMFVTNNKPGMQFVTIIGITAAGTAQITTSVNHNLITGDIVFINETTGTDSGNLNMKSFSITKTGANTFTVPASTAGGINNVGIVQYMTQISPTSTGDGIRWYDGDPSGGSGLGWVNFAPPLDNLASSSTTYLLGAKILIPFGNRLLAIGTFEATSASAASPTYFPNRIRYCEVSATPFYALPVPSGNPATGFVATAWASNIQGFGGFIDLDTTERILSANITQGTMILGLESEQRAMRNTGVETDPFTLQVINPDYGTASTFGTISMDKGILALGEYGLLITSSYDSKRFDEKIIDQIFQVDESNNGFDRVCAVRDFVNEVVYFTYYSDSNDASNTFPDRTIVYNYRENSFATFIENFCTYGIYKASTTETWAQYFIPWENWHTNWEDLGADRFTKPFVAGITPQGYVLLKWSDNSFNHPSLSIQGIVQSGNTYTITSVNHNLSTGAVLGFWSGRPSSGVGLPSFNGFVNQIIDANSFNVTFAPGSTPGSIVPGIWLMSIIDNFDIETKEFELGWAQGQKTRIGTQRYFLDTTALGEFTVNLYASQSNIAINNPSFPSAISSNIVRTRPDDSLGLNDNAIAQTQIWHRLPTSVIGDTVQLEFTLSTNQMLDVNISTSPWVLYSIVLDLYPTRILA